MRKLPAFLSIAVFVALIPGCISQPSTQSVAQPVRQSELNRGSQTGETRSQVIIANDLAPLSVAVNALLGIS